MHTKYAVDSSRVQTVTRSSCRSDDPPFLGIMGLLSEPISACMHIQLIDLSDLMEPFSLTLRGPVAVSAA